MANKTLVEYILRVKAKDAKKGLDQTEKSAEETSKEFNKLSKNSAKVSAGFKAIGKVALAGVAGVTALAASYALAQKAAFNFSRKVVDNVNELNDLSAQSGLTAGSIQAVITAFEGSGQSAGAAASFVSRFPRLFADLASGAGRASEAAAKLGVSLTDATGASKSADQILIDVTKGLQAIEDPTERATTGFLLFGRAAGQFLQAFGATSDFENFVAITDRYGITTGPRASAEAAKFQEQLAFLAVTTKGLQQRFVNAVGGVDFFNDKLTSAIKIVVTLQDFIAENEDLFAELGRNLKAMGGNILGFFQQILPAFSGFVLASFKIIADQLANTAFTLKLFGAISNETYYQFTQGARSAEKAAVNFSEVLSRLADVDFTGETGIGVGGRTGAKDIQGFLDKILAGVSQSAKDARPEVDGLTDSVNKLAKASKQEATDPLIRSLELFESLRDQFSEIDPQVEKFKNTIYRLNNAIKIVEEQGFSTTEAQELLAKAQEKLIAREKELTDARNKAAEESKQLAKKQKQDEAVAVVGLIQRIASLDVASIAGAINPVAGAIVGAVQTIGSKTPKQLREEITAQAKAIRRGIAILPELIVSILPQLAIAITEAIIDGLQLFFINLKNLLVDFFTMDRGERQERRERRRQAIRDFFDPRETLSYASGGRFVPSAQGGIRFTGMQDGMAMLHRGEFVVPQSGQRPQQVDRQLNRSSGGMVININSAVVDRNAVDALVREIEIRFNNTFGTSSSNLFGGR